MPRLHQRPRSFARQTLAAVLGAAALLGAAGPAQAAQSHALIIWIGAYDGPPANSLPGIDKDARMAREMARSIGVPEANITEIGNAAVTLQGMRSAVSALESRMGQGDQVFLYYSGHGVQAKGQGGSACIEALVTRDLKFFVDADLQAALTRIGSKAKQVIMMNDSCFSGGAATKEVRSDGGVPKFLPEGAARPDVAAGERYECGAAVNAFSRNFTPEAMSNRPNVVYIAASSAKEVSLATRDGSAATLAWAACLKGGRADADRSGSVTAEELRACGQQMLNAGNFRQTMTIVGNKDLPLSFQGGGIAGGGGSGAGGGSGGGAPVATAAALTDIANLGDPARRVELRASRSSYKIGQDFLEFTVSTDKPGYLYLLQVGSDGKTFNVIYPNDIDSNHFLNAGSHSFPRANSNLRFRSRGPAGKSHLLALVTDKPGELSAFGAVSGGFRSAPATGANLRNFVAESSQAGGGTFGASKVVSLDETP
ncbi:MAG: DUF4384 domain-containing protein [Rubrivivax sp.]|nr:DUF4384 domain-containing protein [Rubrivivax sp.]